MDMNMDAIHPNTENRAEIVCEIIKKYYEPGNQSKCLRSVWRHHVYPIMPISLRTFQRYCKIGGINWQNLNIDISY